MKYFIPGVQRESGGRGRTICCLWRDCTDQCSFLREKLSPSAVALAPGTDRKRKETRLKSADVHLFRMGISRRERWNVRRTASSVVRRPSPRRSVTMRPAEETFASQKFRFGWLPPSVGACASTFGFLLPAMNRAGIGFAITFVLPHETSTYPQSFYGCPLGKLSLQRIFLRVPFPFPGVSSRRSLSFSRNFAFAFSVLFARFKITFLAQFQSLSLSIIFLLGGEYN